MAYPVPELSTAPPWRYEPYLRQAHSKNWSEAFNTWKDTIKGKAEWDDHFQRGKLNEPIHTSTPIVTCTLYHFPDETTQQYLRRASNDHRIAVEEARRAVSSWLQSQNQAVREGNGRKVLDSLYYTIYHDPEAGTHAQYIVGNINFTYKLENWTAVDCTHRANNKTGAREGAARMLMERERGYCHPTTRLDPGPRLGISVELIAAPALAMVKLRYVSNRTQGPTQSSLPQPLKHEPSPETGFRPFSPETTAEPEERKPPVRVHLKVDPLKDEDKASDARDTSARTPPTRRRLDCVEIPPMRPALRRAWLRSLALDQERQGLERRFAHRIPLSPPPTSPRAPTPEPPLERGNRYVIIAGVRLPVSAMLDTMFYWIYERHELFLRRLEGQPPPWTEDVILRGYRFTNVSRTYDRATQFLIRNVINIGDQTHEELFFRTVLFRLFNRISTYEYLEEHCGPLTLDNFDIKKWSAALSTLRRTGASLYTGAYQINWPDFGAETEGKPSHEKHFILIKHMFDDNLPSKVKQCTRLQDVFNNILVYPSCGQFISYQLALDLNMLPDIDCDQNTWAPAGPGSKQGLLKMFGKGVCGIETEAMLYLLSIQDEHWRRLGVDMNRPIHGPGLCPPQIGLPEIEHGLCEVDKYSRKRHPEIRLAGSKVPTTIKHVFKADLATQPVTADLPLKWQPNNP